MVKLVRLKILNIDGFWATFDDLPADVAQSSLRVKLGYLRDRLEASAEPLM